VTQESKGLVTGDENRFLQAIESHKIRTDDYERISGVLKMVMVKLGLRATNWPNDMEKSVLINHIIQNYGLHTLEEVILAFDMAIAGKLNVEVNCYENFSCLYFSSIMNAYRVWAGQTHSEIKTEKPKELPAPETTEADMFEWVEHTKIQFEKGKIPFNLLPVILFDFLLEKGKITGSKAEAWEKAKSIRVSELHNELCNPHSKKDEIKNELEYLNSGIAKKSSPLHLPASLIAKRIMLVDYFNQTKIN